MYSGTISTFTNFSASCRSPRLNTPRSAFTAELFPQILFCSAILHADICGQILRIRCGINMRRNCGFPHYLRRFGLRVPTFTDLVQSLRLSRAMFTYGFKNIGYYMMPSRNIECLLLPVVIINVARKSSDDFQPLPIWSNLYLSSVMFTKSLIRHMILKYRIFFYAFRKTMNSFC